MTETKWTAGRLLGLGGEHEERYETENQSGIPKIGTDIPPLTPPPAPRPWTCRLRGRGGDPPGGGRAVIPTGIAIALPSAQTIVAPGICPQRAGHQARRGPGKLRGVIDSDYRGEIMVGLYNSGESECSPSSRGSRIAQLMVTPRCPGADVELSGRAGWRTGRAQAASAPTGSKGPQRASVRCSSFGRKKKGRGEGPRGAAVAEKRRAEGAWGGSGPSRSPGAPGAGSGIFSAGGAGGPGRHWGKPSFSGSQG